MAQITVDRSICQHCTLDVCEEEEHFMLKCKKYELLILYLNIALTLLQLRTFVWLYMSNEMPEIIKAVGEFVTQCFMSRNDNRTSEE